jgi:hypothetical protein
LGRIGGEKHRFRAKSAIVVKGGGLRDRNQPAAQAL